MGNTSSIFYPDNGKRRTRAEQLSNDCRYAQSEYDSAKAEIEATLGPYKEKVDKILLAFGCANIDELDELVLQNATGRSLERWNRVRTNYDRSLLVDQVLMVAEGIVAVVGVVVSIVGALAGGFGFFVGIGVTADILLIFGAIGAIYDIINGAVQRSELRDAINKLVPARLGAKYAQLQMEQLRNSLPIIQTIYQMCEDMGYDRKKILQNFKDSNNIKSLKSSQKKLTYTHVGEVLASMDGSRGAWTDEDPNWKPIASNLDLQHDIPATTAAVKARVGSSAFAGLTIANNVVGSSSFAGLAIPNTRLRPKLTTTMAVNADVPRDSELHIRFSNLAGQDGEPLSRSYHVVLKSLEDEHHAKVHLHTEGDQKALIADTSAKSVSLIPIAGESTYWILSFVNSDDAAAFATHGDDFDLSRRPTSATIYVQVGNQYLTSDGSLTSDNGLASAKLTASYA